MTFLLDQPVMLVFAVIGVLLLIALVFDFVRSRRGGTAKAAPGATPDASRPARFSNRVEIAILALVVVPIVILVIVWIAGLVRSHS